jgi:hypothetical protein
MVHLLLSLCNISRPGQDGECKSELFVHLANEAKVQGLDASEAGADRRMFSGLLGHLANV